MTGPSISFCVPVYNQYLTIQNTLNSLLRAAKDFPDVEIVVSENHSDDGTAELVEQYQDRVKVVRPCTHLDMASNWNHAVRNCNGDWIGMVSGDDEIYPSYIPSIRNAIRKSSSAVFAMGGWNIMDVKSGMISRRRVLSLPGVAKRGKATARLVVGPKASFASFCFSRIAFDMVGGFSERYRLVQDWVLQFDLSLIGDFVKTNNVIAQYTTGQDRNQLEIDRIPLYCKDLMEFCLTTIWKAETVGISRSTIIKACELHAARAEVMIDEYPELPNEINNLLCPIYELIGKHRTLRTKANMGGVNFRSSGVIKRGRQFLESILPG